jgi:hypothetical protein
MAFFTTNRENDRIYEYIFPKDFYLDFVNDVVDFYMMAVFNCLYESPIKKFPSPENER